MGVFFIYERVAPVCEGRVLDGPASGEKGSKVSAWLVSSGEARLFPAQRVTDLRRAPGMTS
jgi:hypothetical protein